MLLCLLFGFLLDQITLKVILMLRLGTLLRLLQLCYLWWFGQLYFSGYSKISPCWRFKLKLWLLFWLFGWLLPLVVAVSSSWATFFWWYLLSTTLPLFSYLSYADCISDINLELSSFQILNAIKCLDLLIFVHVL
jgi:hypothetical protein